MQIDRHNKFTQWTSTEWGLPRVYYGGGKSQTSTSQVSIPPEILANYQNVNSIANQVAQTPFQQYSTDPNAFVAPLTPTQQGGINATNQYAGEAQPFYQNASNQNQAATSTGQAATQAAAAPITSAQIQNYENPYESQVITPTEQLMQQQFNQAQSSQLGNAIQNGAFGGDRAAVAAANLQQQQSLAYGQTLGGLLNQNYSQALGEANTEQQAGLQGANQAAQIGMAGATNEANIGSGAQAAGLAGAQAQLTAGQAQQQTEQAGETALYNQFLQQQSYPFQTTQFLGNIAEGTGALSGSTTSSTQPAPYFSDERLKEDMEPVGKTFDGLTLYKYHYKGDKQTHVGLSAQEVEKKHPDAVGLSGGYKTVDYDAATKDAAHRGGSHEGGLVLPYRRRDGSVIPERRHFDVGGYAGLSPNAAWSAGFNLDPSYLQAQEAAYGNAPWGNAGPVSSASPYGGKSHVPPSTGSPHAALAVAHPPQGQAQSGLQQLASGVKQLEGLGKTGNALYNDAKGAVPGLASGTLSPSAPAAPAATAVQVPPDRLAPTSSSGSPIAPAADPSMGRANAQQLAGLDPNALSSSDDMSGLGDDLGSMFSKRGGRIQRADGGGFAMTSHAPTDRIVNHPTMTDREKESKLQTMALKAFPNSPVQDYIRSAYTPLMNKRLGRDAGGATYTDASQDDSSMGGDVPYDSGTGEGGLDIPDDKPHNSLATSQPPSSTSGNGLGDAIGTAGKLAADVLPFFLANRGGRVGLAAGGDPGDPDVPSPDAQPVQALRGSDQDSANSGARLLPQPGQSQSGCRFRSGILRQDDPGGVASFLNRNQGLLVPALHGLGTMASSNSRYLGSAILQGLGRGC